MASAFLFSSAYVMYRGSTASPGTAIVEVAFAGAVCICLYFSYRLIIAINKTVE
jgi:hypothetical protein